MSVFTASDIVEVAIRIEENGINFYKFAEQIAKQEEAKNLFAHLAQAEVAHKKTFEGIFAKMEKYDPPEQYAGEALIFAVMWTITLFLRKKSWINNWRT